MTALEWVSLLHRVVGLLFCLCYAYQLMYLLVPYLVKERPHAPHRPLRYAVLIAARNEAAVLPGLLRALREQTYPRELIDVYVVADNCTDETADLARAAGATVYVRYNATKIGKGYALEEMLAHVDPPCDAYLLFDADNLPAPDFVEKINALFSDGYDIVTGCRCSINHGENWISAGYGIWFLRESMGLNLPRHRLGLSPLVSGTGFGFTRACLARAGGWHYTSLSEDTEFSVDRMLAGDRIGYADDARFYDEQPTELRQSWRQRMRWSRGYLTVMRKEAPRLIRALFGRNRRIALSALDLMLSVLPALFLNLLTLAGNAVILSAAVVNGEPLFPILSVMLSALPGAYFSFVLLGLVTTFHARRRINAPPIRMLAATLTFPLFMFTYLPITLCAMIRPVRWEPIRHGATQRK